MRHETLRHENEHLDAQLDVLAKRGKANGAKVEFIDDLQLKEFIPEAISANSRSIWSPNTCVVKPMSVLSRLRDELKNRGVIFLFSKVPCLLNLVLAYQLYVACKHRFLINRI